MLSEPDIDNPTIAFVHVIVSRAVLLTIQKFLLTLYDNQKAMKYISNILCIFTAIKNTIKWYDGVY